MRSFLCAVAIFLVVTAFVIVNTVCLGNRIEEMLTLSESLPESEEDFLSDYPLLSDDVETLWAMWDKAVRSLSLPVGYEVIDRADEAIIELRNGYRCRDEDVFLTARDKWIDSLRRMKELESFDIRSFI
ncbi:MAG: hypothetical protein KBS76_02880 [Ruminococcus sp.]|nr:hypothetical protein [Candidatus Apopatosoma intestinale]